MGYTKSPLEFRGPAKAFLSAPVCAEVRQESFFPALHANTSGSNLQALVLKTMPSFNPSLASQAFRIPLTINLMSLSENTLLGCALPESSLGAIWLKATAAQLFPIPEKPVRMAGSPEMTPSNSAG